MDRQTRLDIAAAVACTAVAAVAVAACMLAGDRAPVLDSLGARLRHRPDRSTRTMEALMLPQVQREISMMEHGCE